MSKADNIKSFFKKNRILISSIILTALLVVFANLGFLSTSLKSSINDVFNIEESQETSPIAQETIERYALVNIYGFSELVDTENITFEGLAFDNQGKLWITSSPNLGIKSLLKVDLDNIQVLEEKLYKVNDDSCAILFNPVGLASDGEDIFITSNRKIPYLGDQTSYLYTDVEETSEPVMLNNHYEFDLRICHEAEGATYLNGMYYVTCQDTRNVVEYNPVTEEVNSVYTDENALLGLTTDGENLIIGDYDNHKLDIFNINSQEIIESIYLNELFKDNQSDYFNLVGENYSVQTPTGETRNVPDPDGLAFRDGKIYMTFEHDHRVFEIEKIKIETEADANTEEDQENSEDEPVVEDNTEEEIDETVDNDTETTEDEPCEPKCGNGICEKEIRIEGCSYIETYELCPQDCTTINEGEEETMDQEIDETNVDTGEGVCQPVSEIFNIDIPEELNQEIEENFSERNVVDDSLLNNVLEPNLIVKNESEINITFIDEGAGFKNSFGYFIYIDRNQDGLITEDEIISECLIFDNASKDGSGGDLNPGDSVSIGSFEEGTQIGFFIIPDGYENNDNDKLYTVDELNPNDKKHVAMLLTEDQENIILGIEDLPNGDDDYNDIIFKVDAQNLDFEQKEAELSKVLLHTCAGDGEIYAYENQFDSLDTSFQTNYEELLIFTNGEINNFSVKSEGTELDLKVIAEYTRPFPVRVYKVLTQPGSIVSVSGLSSDKARAIQGYIVQNSATPIFDDQSFQLVYDDERTNSVYLEAGSYSFVFFDKYTYKEDKEIDERKLTISTTNPSGEASIDEYNKPSPFPMEGLVLHNLDVEEAGEYNLRVITEDSVYWPLMNCPVPSENQEENPEETKNSVGDTVWMDENSNGVVDNEEVGIEGVTVYLIEAGADGIFDSEDDINYPPIQTDENGKYTYDNLPDGKYRIMVASDTLPAGAESVYNDEAVEVSLDSGNNRDDIDFGYQIVYTKVEGHVFNDENEDGIQGENEPDLGGVTAVVRDLAGNLQAIQTDDDGDFNANVPIGEITLSINRDTLFEDAKLTTDNDPQIVFASENSVTNASDIGYNVTYASVGGGSLVQTGLNILLPSLVGAGILVFLVVILRIREDKKKPKLDISVN